MCATKKKKIICIYTTSLNGIFCTDTNQQYTSKDTSNIVVLTYLGEYTYSDIVVTTKLSCQCHYFHNVYLKERGFVFHQILVK